MGPEFSREMKMKSRMLRTARLLAVVLSAVCLLFATGLAAAQEPSTLLVLRPQPKSVPSDKNRTVSPGKGANVVVPLISSQVSEIKIGGKPASITAWTPLLNGPTKLQLVVLFDPQLRIGLGKQFDEIKALFNSLPSNVEIAVGILLQGKVVIKQPFTTDRTLAGNALHLPTMEDVLNPKNVSRGLSGLGDLVNHWPDPDPKKVRAVLLFTNGGVGDSANNLEHGGAIPQIALLRAGIVPFTVFYINLDLEPDGVSYRLDPLTGKAGYGGQDNLDYQAWMTNGAALYYPHWMTTTFTPLLNMFYSILSSEAVVTVTVKGSGLQRLDIKSNSDEIKVVGPDEVVIGNVLLTK